MMHMKLAGIFLLLFLTGCGDNDKLLRIHAPDAFRADPEAMQAVFDERTGLDFEDAQVDARLSPVEMLVRDQADLALVENSTPFETGVRAVLPVYKSALHLLVRDDVDIWDDDQPLRGKQIYIDGNSDTGLSFVRIVASRMGLREGDYQLVDSVTPGETDLLIYFGAVNADNQRWFVEGYHLETLGLRGRDSNLSAEAIGYLIPQLKTFEIPAGTYTVPGGDRAVETVAVTTLLATRKAASADTIYELTRVLLEEKQRFVKISPALFSGINDKFDPLDLNFPLHEGARRYLSRDEPSTLERYAETINLLVYMAFLLLTGVVAFARFRARRKKDRIDRYYASVLDIRRRAKTQSVEQSLEELRSLEEEAFAALIEEKLAADESFRIFIELANRTVSEIEANQPR